MARAATEVRAMGWHRGAGNLSADSAHAHHRCIFSDDPEAERFGHSGTPVDPVGDWRRGDGIVPDLFEVSDGEAGASASTS